MDKTSAYFDCLNKIHNVDLWTPAQKTYATSKERTEAIKPVIDKAASEYCNSVNKTEIKLKVIPFSFTLFFFFFQFNV